MPLACDLDIDAPSDVAGSKKHLKYSNFLKKSVFSEFKVPQESVDEIAEVFIRFQAFLSEGIGEERLENKYVKVFLRAMNLDPSPMEISSLIEEIDSHNSESITFYQFGEIIKKIMRRKSSKLELLRAYRQFDEDSKGYISIEDLRRAAKAAGENMADVELEELISVADSTKTGIVTKKDFFDYMKIVHFSLEEM